MKNETVKQIQILLVVVPLYYFHHSVSAHINLDYSRLSASLSCDSSGVHTHKNTLICDRPHTLYTCMKSRWEWHTSFINLFEQVSTWQAQCGCENMDPKAACWRITVSAFSTKTIIYLCGLLYMYTWSCPKGFQKPWLCDDNLSK